MKGNFYSLVKKEALHILRDKRTLLVVMLIPITLMLLFGFAISTEVKDVRVATSYVAPSPQAHQLANRLAHNPYFTYCGTIGQQDIDRQLRSGEVDVVLLFASHLDKRQTVATEMTTPPMVKVIVDASNINTANASVAYLLSSLQTGASQQDLFETRLLFNPQMKSTFHFVPGIMGLIFILICALMTSVSIVREKEMGTMEVLLVSPVRPAKIILAKMIPYFAISCAILAITLLLARYVLHLPMSGGMGGVIIVSLLYLALSLSLGLMVSTLVRTQVAALLTSAVVMMMPILMLSGMLFPIENLPTFFQIISHIVPARWYIDAMRKMMIQGVPLSDVWPNVLILLLMTLGLLGASLKKFNDKLA